MQWRWLVGLQARVQALFRRDRFEADLDEELRFHLDQATARYVRAGLSPSAAARAARRDLGGLEQTKERVRCETGVRLLQDLGQDARLGLRDVRRRPGFASAVVLTLALCMAAHGVVLSVVNSVLLRPLAFPHAQRLVRIFNSYPEAGTPRSGNSVPDYLDRRRLVPALDDVALFTRTSYVLGGGEAGRLVPGLVVTSSFFSVLGVAPALGRVFDHDLTRQAPLNEVIIGHALWQSGFGGAADAVGSSVALDGERHRIVGVLPAGFQFSAWRAQLFTPLSTTPRQRSDAARHRDFYQMIGRLADGASITGAQSQIDALNRSRVEDYPQDLRVEMAEAGYVTIVRPYLDDLTREVRRPLALLWAGVLLVLVMGAVNVTVLLMMRTRGRSHEIATRVALGASRGRMLRQLLAESLLLAALGGGAGLVLMGWGLRFVGVLDVYAMPRLHEVSLDPGVAGITLLIIIAVATAAGGAQAAIVSRRVGALAGGHARIASGPSRSQRALVSGQIALAFVLVMSAGLLAATVRMLATVDTGFESGNLAVAAISLPDTRYANESTRLELARRVVEAVDDLPQVLDVAVADHLPFLGNAQRISVVPEGGQPAGGAVGRPVQTVVSPGYFDALGVPVRSGRGFRASDDLASPRVALVDEALARRYWPSADPVGRRLWRGQPGDALDPATAMTVVGVVGSLRQDSLAEPEPVGAYYVPLSQAPLGSFRLAVRVAGEPSEIWPSVRAAVASIDPNLVIASTTTLADQVAASLALQRVPMQLLSVFAVIGLVLGAVGVYGVVAHSVARRSREIGLRLAIGSTRRQIAALVGREWIGVVGRGLLVGVLGAAASTRFLASLLHGIAPLDPIVLAGTTVMVLTVAGIACLVPVRRAVSIAPAAVLKDES